MKTPLKKITVAVFFYFILFSPGFSQVKVGSNATTIDPNSLLELESSTKGFLPPRVALTSTSSVSPLSGTVPEGMMVYSDAGSVTDGFYYWSGTKWLFMANSTQTRNNMVIVKSAADFPAAVSGVITLVSGTVYQINGTIVLTNKIDLNNSVVVGLDALNDKLVYTPSSGELFTGTHGGQIRIVTLVAQNAGAKVFNLDAGGAALNLNVMNSYIASSNNVGLVKGFGGNVYFQTVGYLGNTNGITFQDINNLILFNTMWNYANYNTYEKFTGTFNIIQKVNGAMGIDVNNSAVALDVSGITSINAGELKTVFINGNGTKLVGSFSSAWEVECNGFRTEKDDQAAGNIYLTGATATSFSGANVPVLIAGTTAVGELFRCTSSQNNRLTYTGAKTRWFQVICSLSITVAGSNKYFSFYIYKNGVLVPESRQALKLGSNQDKGSVTLSCALSMSTNDYIEVWIENNSDATTTTVESMNLSIK